MATLAQPAGRFALGTFSAQDGEPFPGLLVKDRVLDLGRTLAWAPSGVRAVVERWEEALPVLHVLADEDALDWRPLEGLRVHAPLEPRQIFQSGANYRQHVIDLEVAHRSPDDPRTVQEARAEIATVMDRRAAEDLPYVFIGLPSAIAGPYDDVALPTWAEKPDWELELAAVIAKPAHRVSVAEAMEYVAGYTIANDLTDRATVFRRDMKAIGTDWLRCKNAPGFTPLGPWLVPAESIAAPGDLRVTLKLNGETMQDESTKDMLFGVARLVSYISQTSQLLPGDLVLTGSPAGNGIHWGRLLRDGDLMEGSITGLGVQRTRCVAEGPS
ncbi:2-keto-4-pentenoate hydratase/2-oxohepta-3-ene-1,7-dioic acid hydratase in catechol pathway [Streptomyces phaeochromogenes]|jgi:2-keto-4-pentenoate hydratase/2-oxohepta-3-ene-1,7-dioic acid hydratase in catechol pathway|uniref:fumarylacetoacetate hydrolase family protein n=1 Tax=Streptomyces phaeochromogenes TaxID=1923 RepID=UPI00278CE703|nr:fumarylacetoacetate hydrolase family protein [Streptomyces phaeochromogenes]MDQ0946948.1 2-keto-4-pentenoate hydratase/2-oxohepta-3-ene-1,7-dioic acid hydratase in catechol pathway [Streptomyces phaeochromogenes]